MATGDKPRVVLGVSGGIAAYKSCDVLRSLTETGHHVDVVPTESALRFVGSATFEALSGNPVTDGVFSDVPSVRHVRLGQQADLVLVVPATADLMARMAHGNADDLLTATLLTAHCPVAIAPAMHTEMWEHAATRANVATLRERGVTVIGPAIGRLTGKDTGPGRLAEPNEIADLARLLIERPNALPADLDGLNVVVTAGGTRESLDPVRFLTNRSSGKQGYAIARVAAARGANVTMIAANVDFPEPAGAQVVRVSSADQLAEAVRREMGAADVIVMAAAVSDFRPAAYSEAKIKKSELEPDAIELTKNPDILVGLVTSRAQGDIPADCTIVGFAAETGDKQHSVEEYGRAKMARKGADMMVVNSVGDGGAFESDHNSGWILDAVGADEPIEHGSKYALAAQLWDHIGTRRSAR
ncbi:bifunctional phosphopantothenoylcysteine decarboxylase/phosphopantothenate--cysteine ligase CoaBC [Epidermidibacterium keratini]|uniref:Coenzyme A biosynthesis bifunctional protein CoaBC n=1 Tax=Epidermidibacterium keratini TaxID=1891644 RepID=A0A7L4YJH8_9ACTN|nr:bifunctional phosphopantothenoylcysteine decarboxylase/phosphopantothenate--cysteine ligase CoaBC [Epidermidibacterium keratini]QHB99013.1 bifunctional phosphopantothenoylcysteine decarboxylase/phosphopantothenate--cysteine ligase CoaBC [Epidermidibacterium keratini]